MSAIFLRDDKICQIPRSHPQSHHLNYVPQDFLTFPCKSFQLSTQNNKIIKSPFQVHFTISSCCHLKSLRNPFKSQWSPPFYGSSSSSTGTNKGESSLRRPCKWIPFLVRSSHPSPSFIHRHCSLSSSFSESWFVFYLPNFFSFAQFNSVLLCFFVCP